MLRDVRGYISKQQSPNAAGFIFLLFSLLLIFHVLVFFAGFYGDDDINFARYAGEIKNYGINTAKAIDHFQLRWTPIYGTAFFYTIFGVNDFSSALYSLCCMLGCGWLIFQMTKNEGLKICLLTCILFFLGRSVIFYSHRLLADPGICLAVLAMYFAYRNLQHRSISAGLLFAVALIGAVMTKESVIIALPLFTLLFLFDLFRKSARIFWVSAILFSGIFLFIYLFYFRVTTGDWLFRYHLIYQGSYQNICSFDQLPVIETLRRIGYQLWQAMLLNGDFLVLIPAVAALFYFRDKQIKGLRKLDLFAFLTLLLLSNFMSISWRSYVPLCHDPRHFLFIIPFAAIVGGRMLTAFSAQPSRYRLLPVLYSLATIVIFASQSGSTKYLYLACSLLTVMLSVFPRYSSIFLPGILLIFSLNYWMDLVKPLYPFAADNKTVAGAISNFSPGNSIVYSEGFTGEMAEYYLGFPKGKYKFFPIDSLPVRSRQTDSTACFLLDGKNDLLSRNEIMALPGSRLITSRNEATLITGDTLFFQKLFALIKQRRLQ